MDLSNPATYGVSTGKALSFFINSHGGKIGAWYLEPEGKSNNSSILYLHGVKGTRGRSHRVELYKILLKAGYHILTIDYRGFGDATDTSEDEDTVVQDAREALTWLREKVGKSCKIFVWGHSMGTGVASHAVAKEFIEKGFETQVDGVVLEAPFNNFTDELIFYTKNTSNPIAKSALSALYSSTGETLPGALLSLFNMKFNSDSWVPYIKCPVLILHAKEDAKIPFSLAEKLFNDVIAAGKTDVTFHAFEEGIEHHTIYNSKKLPSIIKEFTDNSELKEESFKKVDVIGYSQHAKSVESSEESKVFFCFCCLMALLAYFFFYFKS